jgi:hypothetical protein
MCRLFLCISLSIILISLTEKNMTTRNTNRSLLIFAAVAMLSLTAASTQAGVIYQDDFSGSDGANLFGTGPDVDNNGGGNTWSGTNGVFEANGDVSGNGGVWLPFNPTSGNIYQLSGSIDMTGGDWITLGFNSSNPDAHFNTTAGTPYGTALVRVDNNDATSDFTTFDGEGLNGQGDFETGNNGFNVIDIVLDATDANSANWTVAFSVDGNLVAGPNTITESGTWPGTGDLGTIQYVGFSSVGSSTGVIDDFSLTIIPEPATMSLLALGGLGLLRRRRNRA